MSTTRRQLRQSIGRLVGDLLLVTATSAGSTTSIVDSVHLGTADGTHIGRHGIVSGGTAGNLGRLVRVTDNDRTAASLTFTPALPIATATGDIIEFYNERETATGPDTINDAINDVIGDVAPSHRTEAESDEFDWSWDDSDGLTIPEAWNGFIGVEFADWAGRWLRAPLTDVRVNKAQRLVFLDNRARWLADGQTVRLRGYTAPSILTTDDATTTINQEFLRLQVAANILNATAYKRSNSVESRQDAASYQSRANAIRPKVVRRGTASWIRLD